MAEADEAAFEPADGGGGREAYAAWRRPMPREGQMACRDEAACEPTDGGGRREAFAA